MSVLAETADIINPSDETPGWAEARQDTLKFAEAALADSKREGLLLAVRARWVALAVTAATLPIINPNWEVLYYVLMLGIFALIGWTQLKVGSTAERSWPELILIFCVAPGSACALSRSRMAARACVPLKNQPTSQAMHETKI